ncbi:hypothetical protein ALC57_15113 [Trachymyrmex cornetzi]|uniref:Integrase catalytic domain-containing protein n=1 Tax=Trachymyrmex cornetzi TaxID=471704 RepID=A0A151IXC3_9HYME|nr:hypothetical protein ALC57_15113 [Trachymyrmex cornetzi]
MSTSSKGIVRIVINSTKDDFSRSLTCLTLPSITDLIPAEIFPRDSIKIPPNIKLADPEFHLPRPIDLLIGSGATVSLFSVGQINLSRDGHDLYLQKTRLGWVIVGGTTSQTSSKSETCHVTNLEAQLDKFWALEDTIKAVHLEVVSDLTSDGFLAVLRRFVARRGMPEHIYSDNGTNFVGANKQLREMYALFNSDQHKEQVNKFACNHRITWHFIPPAAPHFGGLWESMVKLFKHHFKRVVGDSLFTFKELNTFTIKIESILNSRPITILSCDLNDLLVLSPAHYLIGKRLTALPEGNLTSVPANRLSTWQHISKVRQHFWARWNLEYLNELQVRVKWVKDEPQFVTGAVVLIKDKNLPCNQWALGRITKIHPGDDGRVRAATVKTANGEVERAARYLCLLPVER